MKIELKDGEIVCVMSAWKDLNFNEKKFYDKCYWHHIFDGYSEELNEKGGYLTYRKGRLDLTAIEFNQRLNGLFYWAETYQIEVAEEVREYRQKAREKANEERKRVEFAQAIQFKRDVWESRKKSGCQGCEYMVECGNGDFSCRYSGDILKTRIGEYYDIFTGAYTIFHEMGEPNEHCKNYFNERIKEKVS